jgi:hypothetical protein
MTAIDTYRTALFGSPPSPTHTPSREGSLAAFTELQQELLNSISSVALGNMVSVAYETRAELEADLAHDANATGLVYADPNPANIDFYTKVGASGTGSWTLTSIIHDLIAALTQGYVDDAEAAATSATASAAYFSEALGPLYKLIALEDAEVFSRGSYTVSGTSINSGLKGWRSPFKHDGSVFNVIELTLKASAENTRALITILDSSKVEITRGYAVVGTNPTVCRVVLNKMVRTLAADAIAYVGYEPADSGGVLGYPGGGAYDGSDADPNTYREQYLNGSNVWTNASPIGSYRTNFRLMNYTNKIQAGSFNQLWELVTTGLVTVYSLPGYSGFDSTYSADGVGTSMPAQAFDIDFNVVAVYGGCNGPGVMRGYLVDSATAADHIPSSADTLLFEHDINWSLDVQLRTELLDEVHTVPAGKRLDVLWVCESATDVVVARWSTNDDGNLPRFRFCLTGVGDETGIWGNTWNQGGSGFWTVPPTLKISNDGTVVETVVPQFTVPAIIDTMVGKQINLYHDGIVSADSDGLEGLEGYSVSIVGPKGKNKQRCWQYTPLVGDIGTHAFTAKLFDSAGALVSTKTFSVRVNAAAPKGVAKNILIVADSLGAGSVIPLTVLENFTALGAVIPTFVGTQRAQSVVAASVAGLGVGAVYTESGHSYDVRAIEGNTVFLGGGDEVALPTSGTLTKSSGSGPGTLTYTTGKSVLHLGLGGKSFAYFAGSGGISYRLTVSGVTSVSVGAVYSIGVVNYTVTEVNISGGAGNILVTGASAPASSGTATRVSGSGDTTVNYSAMTVVPGNPLWNPTTEELDFDYFCTENGVTGDIAGLLVDLGINDNFGESVVTTASINEDIGYAQDIADAALAHNASCKTIFGLTALCGNTADGFAANYGASYSRDVYEQNIFAFRKGFINAFDSGAYHANVFIGAAGLVMDRFFGYNRVWEPISSRVYFTDAANTATQLADLTPVDGSIFRCTDSSIYIVKVGSSTRGFYRQADERDGFQKVHDNAVHPGVLGGRQRGDQHTVELIAVL